MAVKIKKSVVPKDFVIRQFLGLNMPLAGDTQIYPGESGNMYNCYITKDYDLAKMYGYLQLMTDVTNKPIQGMWYGKIGNTPYFLFAINGHLYKIDNNHWTTNFDGTDEWSTVTTDLGTLTDDKTHFFAFNDKVYILNGHEYKSFDGTNLVDVTGYIPKIAISCTPATGTGTPWEELNLLNGKKHTTYNGDATATYQLPEKNIDSVDFVYVDGVLKTATTHYTVNLTNGTITFTGGNIPDIGLDNVDIYWTKGAGDRDLVYKNRFSYLYDGNRIFLYGNPDRKNEILFSPLAAGIPTAEYFSEWNTISLGDANSYVTGIEMSQNILLIYKENETYYAQYDIIDLDGSDTVNFPAKVINKARGNVAIGQTQLLNNDPFSIDYQLIKWYPTTVENERNMQDMGYHIQRDLNQLNLHKTLSIDKQNTNEMFMSNGKKVWIYHYNLKNPYTKQNDIFSRLYLEDEPTCWLLVEGNLFFGTTDGKIMKFSEDYLTYNGEPIKAHWEMNMYDFGANWYYKSLNKSWIALAPQPKTYLELQYVTDKNATGTPYNVEYQIVMFDDVDYSDFSFDTNYNPQTFYIRLKAKKFVYLKMVLDNNETDSSFIVLNLTLKAEYGSNTK